MKSRTAYQKSTRPTNQFQHSVTTLNLYYHNAKRPIATNGHRIPAGLLFAHRDKEKAEVQSRLSCSYTTGFGAPCSCVKERRQWMMNGVGNLSEFTVGSLQPHPTTFADRRWTTSYTGAVECGRRPTNFLTNPVSTGFAPCGSHARHRIGAGPAIQIIHTMAHKSCVPLSSISCLLGAGTPALAV